MKNAHILPLTGVRLVAAAAVVFYHFGGRFQEACPLLSPFQHVMSLGYYAVPFFFILSGFILSHNYFSNYSLKDHPKFIFYRFARLWPVHAVTFLLALNYAGYQMGAQPVWHAAQELSMTRSWYSAELASNYPAWTISAEWFAYLCVFPIAFLAFSRIRSIRILLGTVAVLLAAAAYFPEKNILARGGNIAFLFSAGSALYRIRCLAKSPAPLLFQKLGVLLIALFVLFTNSMSNAVIFIGFAALIYGLSFERGMLSQVLSTKFFVAGGLASYSLYMTHAVVGNAFNLLTINIKSPTQLEKLGLLVVFVFGLAGAALAFYRFVEEPANRALRSLISQPKSKSAPVPANASLAT